ncbi:hypothetical protein ABC766_10310 [Methylobacterium fujisawaense]|uniref:hypothetical protein n=1 Tax=Methylobacterium fujisawaense TaxID=107400 RepID=UPI0031F551D4
MPVWMSWLRSRSVCAWFLTLALVAGFALHGVQAAHMKASMPVAAMQASMPDGCDGCDEGGKAFAACSLLCAGFIAIAPAAVGPQIIGASFAYVLADVEGVSLQAPPDPFPPKSPVLS